MAQAYDRRINLYINVDGKEVNNNVKSITAEMRKIENGQKQMTIGSSGYVKETYKIQQLQAILKGHAETIGRIETPMQKVIGVAKGLLPAFGFAAIGALASQAFGKIISATDAIADKWEFAMAGMKNGTDYFWKTLASGNWENFFSNFNEAVKVGYRYASMLDSVEDKTRSLSMVESDARSEELRLEEAVKNKLLSKEDRIKAGEDRIKLEETLSAKRTKIADEEFEAEILISSQRSNLSKEQLIQITKDIDSEAKIKADAYNEQVEQYNKLRKQNVSQVSGSITGYSSTIQLPDTKEMINLKKEFESAPASIKTYAGAINQYSNLTKDMMDRLATSYINKNAAENSSIENTKKVRNLVHTLMAGQDAEGQKLDNGASDKAAKVKKEASDKEYADLEIANRKDMNLIKQHQVEVNASVEDYNKLLQEEELNALNKKLALQIKFGEDTSETMAVILDKQLKIQEDIDKKTEEEKKKLYEKELDNLDNQQKNELALVKKDALAKGLTEEQTNALLIAKELEFLNNKLVLEEKYGQDTVEPTAAITDKINALAENAVKGDEDRAKELSDLKKKYLDEEVLAKEEKVNDLAQLDQLYQAGAITSYEEYQRLKSEINNKYEQSRLDKAIEFGQKAQQFVSMGSNLVQTLMDAELAKAGDNEEKKAQIKKKYANVQFLMAASEIVVNTAVAIMQGFAQLGPIGGAIAAVILGATGAVQLGMANAEREKMQGYASGGFTNGDAIYRAGEEGKEWIAPTWMTTHPLTGPIIAGMENWRRNPISVSAGAIEASKRSGNAEKFNSVNSSGINTVSNQPSVDRELKQILKEQISSINKLNSHLDKGIRASMNKYGVNGLEDSMKDIYDFKSKNFKK